MKTVALFMFVFLINYSVIGQIKNSFASNI